MTKLEVSRLLSGREEELSAKRRACQERVGKNCATKLCAYPRLTRACVGMCVGRGVRVFVCVGGGGGCMLLFVHV